MKYECEWCYHPIYDGPPIHRVRYAGHMWYTHRHCTAELVDELDNERDREYHLAPVVSEISTATYIEEMA